LRPERLIFFPFKDSSGHEEEGSQKCGIFFPFFLLFSSFFLTIDVDYSSSNRAVTTTTTTMAMMMMKEKNTRIKATGA